MPCKYSTFKEPCERFGRKPFETMGRDMNENYVWQMNVEGAGERKNEGGWSRGGNANEGEDATFHQGMETAGDTNS